ncbi:hypothetical protein RZ68_06450 [[Haemophilus] ducreyi]|nr:DUF5339 domain-containing protein [[Haemophilus] ducreyi]AKO48590.1 hypothetical protein RZ68_06450 [[Haemophilus] ducreyi]
MLTAQIRSDREQLTQTASERVQQRLTSQSSYKVLVPQCKQMFSVAHKLVLDAEKQPGTHVQVTKMKNKLSSTKQQIIKMEVKMQEKSCDKGLTALNTLKQKH